MFPPESVDEHERLGKLFGSDKKSRAVNLPLTAGIHLLPPLGEVVGNQLTIFALRLTIFLSDPGLQKLIFRLALSHA